MHSYDMSAKKTLKLAELHYNSGYSKDISILHSQFYIFVQFGFTSIKVNEQLLQIYSENIS